MAMHSPIVRRSAPAAVTSTSLTAAGLSESKLNQHFTSLRTMRMQLQQRGSTPQQDARSTPEVQIDEEQRRLVEEQTKQREIERELDAYMHEPLLAFTDVTFRGVLSYWKVRTSYSPSSIILFRP
jgi:molybdopterin-biosynthesis enzyme MoeA-like protein